MTKKEYNAYSLFCKSLDTMGSALAFGSSLARAATQANEQMTKAWEFPDKRSAPVEAIEETSEVEQEGPSAIDLAREAVSRKLEELTGIAQTDETPVDFAAAPEPPEAPTPPPPVQDEAKAPDPAVAAQQADQLDDRAKRLLARFVEPDPDFFKRSPFEDWDEFPAPTRKTN